MKTRYLVSAVILSGLLPFASAPASASVAGMTQGAITLTENTDLIQVQRRVYRGAQSHLCSRPESRCRRQPRCRRAPRPLSRPLRLPRRPVGAPAQLLVADRRCGCRRRRTGHGRGKHRGVGRPGPRSGLLLVLHRSEPAAGLLGPVPVTARLAEHENPAARRGFLLRRSWRVLARTSDGKCHRRRIAQHPRSFRRRRNTRD